MNIISVMKSTVQTTALASELTAPRTPLEALMTTLSPMLDGRPPRNAGSRPSIVPETVMEPVFDRPRMTTTVFRPLPANACRVCLLIPLMTCVMLPRHIPSLPMSLTTMLCTRRGLPNLFLICMAHARAFILTALPAIPRPLLPTVDVIRQGETLQVLTPSGLRQTPTLSLGVLETDMAFILLTCVNGPVIPLLRTPHSVDRSLLVLIDNRRTGTTLAENPKRTGARILLGRPLIITLSPLCMLPAYMLTLQLHLNLRATIDMFLPEADATRPRRLIEPSIPLKGCAMPPLTLLDDVLPQQASITTAPALTLGHRLTGSPSSEKILKTTIV